MTKRTEMLRRMDDAELAAYIVVVRKTLNDLEVRIDAATVAFMDARLEQITRETIKESQND